VNEHDDSFPAVELRGVTKRFGDRLILDQIDLAVARGEILVLVGKSGSGKSTLLKMVSGIDRPDTGRVHLAGRDCTDLPPYRRPVHTVFQNYALFPHLTVLENVAFPLRIAAKSGSECQRRAREALAWVQLAQHASRPITGLSGGERQRVALARALVNSPQCVLLDEPLSALDPHLRAETLELLQDIQARLAATFLFITHDREEALRLGHRVGVLNQGRLEQIGTPQQVYSRPQTAFVASFLGRINWLHGELARNGRTASLVINGQALACSCHASHAPGPVKIGIRPEDLSLSTNGGLPVTVIHSQFLGDSTHVRLKLTTGVELLMDRRAGDRPLAAGEQVNITWNADAPHLYPEETEA
jgi:ABC-type Fe3+/spermidine/putrescine transport system ATPase subunit